MVKYLQITIDMYIRCVILSVIEKEGVDLIDVEQERDDRCTV